VGIPAGDSNWLWVRSRGTCAHPDCSARLVHLEGGRLITQGQRAHIRSDVAGGPRFDPAHPNPDSFENLILLCRDHHNVIDSDAERYPVELLEEWKRTHEGPGFAGHPLITSPPPMGPRYARRTDLFQQIHKELEERNSIVLVGLAGAGKTQTASDIFRDGTEYALRLWIRARETESRFEDFARAGPYLGIVRHDDERLSDYCRRVCEALEATAGWLIVFDDVPTIDALHGLVPRFGGHVLITSQAQGWPIPTISVGPLSRQESVALLSQHPALVAVPPGAVETLAALAGDLPLCLVQLTGYLDVTGMPLDVLISTFEHRRASLLARGAPPDHLAIRVSVSNAVDRLSENGKALLAALSVLAPVPLPIPADLTPIDGDDVLGPLADRIALEDAIGELRGHSLIEREADRLSCHEVTQVLVADFLAVEERRSAVFRALSLVGTLLPSQLDRHEQVPTALALLPHAKAILEKAEPYPEIGHLAAHLVNRLAPAYGLIGEPARAEAELRRALSIAERSDENDLGLRGSILHNLSNCAADRGYLNEAIDLARKALNCKTAAGHPPESVAVTSGTLGCHLEEVGDLEEALTLHQRAVELLEPVGHVRWLADALNDTARVLRKVGRDIEPADASERAIATAFSDADAWAELADAYLNLALLAEDSDIDRSLDLAELAVRACERAAVQSVALAKSLGTRGRLRNNIGDFGGIADVRAAVVLYDQFEPDGVNYGRTLGNLGWGLVRLGFESSMHEVQADGLSALRRSRDILRQVLPEDHPTVVTAEDLLEHGSMVWGATNTASREHPPYIP
jgi:tetratricopeptide (TPR) repeat protein